MEPSRVIDDTKIKLEEDVTSASFSFPNETPPTPAMSIKEQLSSLESAKAQKTMAAKRRRKWLGRYIFLGECDAWSTDILGR